jgi:quercetin dioxygenase-like cupin family protein
VALQLAIESGPRNPLMYVQRWDVRRDGALSARRLRQRLEAQGLWVSERRLAPGAPHPRAAAEHDSVEVVLNGRLRVCVNGEVAVLSAGDAAFVPRGATSHLEAVGSDGVVAFSGAYLPSGPSWPANRRGCLHSIWR